MTKKIACVTGITGQVGSYLAELLLDKGFKVYGLKRRSSNLNTQRIDHLYDNDNLKLVYGDLTDYSSLTSLINDVKPTHFYNLAAQSHVRVSFDIPMYTMDVTGTGVMRCLEAIRKNSKNTRFVQISSSECFGSSPPPQDEQTPFHPRSPYAVAKTAGYWTAVNYRESYDMFAANIIMFNTESPRRGETFVTRKITRAAARIKQGLQKKLYLGNLDAKRDWSHAYDMANAIYMISEASSPSDYAVASGQMHSVREFLEKVFSTLDLNWQDYVEFDERFLRPAEVDALCGNPAKIKKELGWKPKYSFESLVNEMIKYDLSLAIKEKLMLDNYES